MRVCTFKSGAKVRSFSGRNDEISVVNARNPIFYSKIADSIAFVTTRVMGRYALSYGPLRQVVNAEACSARHTCRLATAVIQRRTQQRRLFALANTTVRSHQHDCSHCLARPFEPASSIVRSCSLVKPQTPIHSDKTVNTSGQNRWTTKVIHPSRLLVSLFTTARIALHDCSYCSSRLLASLCTTARIALHDCSCPLARYTKLILRLDISI